MRPDVRSHFKVRRHKVSNAPPPLLREVFKCPAVAAPVGMLRPIAFAFAWPIALTTLRGPPRIGSPKGRGWATIIPRGNQAGGPRHREAAG